MQGKKKNTFNPWGPKQANWEKRKFSLKPTTKKTDKTPMQSTCP